MPTDIKPHSFGCTDLFPARRLKVSPRLLRGNFTTLICLFRKIEARTHLVEQIGAGLAERVVRLAPAGDDADLALERVVHRGQADRDDVVPLVKGEGDGGNEGKSL